MADDPQQQSLPLSGDIFDQAASQPQQAQSAGPTYDAGPQAGQAIPGMLQQGNIDVNHRPSITNADGSHSSIYSMTAPIDKDGSLWKGDYDKAPQYALVPSIANGKFLTPDGNMPTDEKGNQALEDAADDYYDKNRQHLGIFKTAKAANDYATQTHAWGNDGTSRKVFAPSASGDIFDQVSSPAAAPAPSAPASSGIDIFDKIDMSKVAGAVPGTPAPSSPMPQINMQPVPLVGNPDTSQMGVSPDPTAYLQRAGKSVVQGVKDIQQGNPAFGTLQGQYGGQTPEAVRAAPQNPAQAMTGAAEVVEGVVPIAATVAAPELLANPLTTAAGVAGGYVAGKGAQVATKAAGGSPEAQRLAGDIGGVVGGVAGGAMAGGGFTALKPRLTEILSGKSPAPTGPGGLPPEILGDIPGMEHPAGRVTGIDQATGLPIVDRSGGGGAAPQGGGPAEAAPTETEETITDPATGKQTIVKTQTKPAEKSALDEAIANTIESMRDKHGDKSPEELRQLRDDLAQQAVQASNSGDQGKAQQAAAQSVSLDQIAEETEAHQKAGITPEGAEAGRETAKEESLSPEINAATNVVPPIGDKDKESDRTVVQPTDHPATNQALATSDHPAVKQTLSDAIKGIAGVAMAGDRDQKPAERTAEKVADENQPSETIPDYSGFRVSVDSPEAKDKAVAAIKVAMPVVKEKDEFDKGSPEEGFHAHMLQVQGPNGATHEIQVLPKEVADIAEPSHDLYEKSRSGDKEATADLRQQNLDAWDKFNKRNGTQKNWTAAPSGTIQKGDRVEVTRGKKAGQSGVVEWADQNGDMVRFTSDEGGKVNAVKSNLKKVEAKPTVPIEDDRQRGKPKPEGPYRVEFANAKDVAKGSSPKGVGIIKDTNDVGWAIGPLDDMHKKANEWNEKEGHNASGNRAEQPGTTTGSNESKGEKDNAVRKQGAAGVLQQQPKKAGERSGGQVQQREQGTHEPARAQPEGQPRSEEEGKGGGAHGEQVKSETKTPESETKYEYGSTQIAVPIGTSAHRAIERMKKEVKDDDLAGKGKDIDIPHVTIRYGIQGDNIKAIHDYLKSQKPFNVDIGPTDSFPPTKSSDGAAVLIARVKSPELDRMNKEIAEHGDFKESDFKEYKPHVTIAYVKPEAIGKYTGNRITALTSFMVTQAEISDRDGKTEVVLLGTADDRYQAKKSELGPLVVRSLQTGKETVIPDVKTNEKVSPEKTKDVTPNIIQAPSGRWVFAGKVPGDLLYEMRQGGGPITPELADKIRKFGEGLFNKEVKHRSWDTKQAAMDALEEYERGNAVREPGKAEAPSGEKEAAKGAGKPEAVAAQPEPASRNPAPEVETGLRTYEAEVSKYAGDPKPRMVRVQAENRRHAEQMIQEQNPGMRVSSAGRVETGVATGIESKPETEASNDRLRGQPGAAGQVRGDHPRLAEAEPTEATETTGTEREAEGTSAQPGEAGGKPDRSSAGRGGGRVSGNGVRKAGALPGERAGRPELGADDRPVEAESPDSPADAVKRVEKTVRNKRNYRIKPDNTIGEGGVIGKARGNIAAIRLAKQLEKDGAIVTDAQKDVLAKYVGWGGIPQIFDVYRQEFRNLYNELKEVLTPEEYDFARGSTINAHYTSPEVVKAMWEMADKLGYKGGGTILEPSAGIGTFFGLMPDKVSNKSQLLGIEKDKITGLMLKHLYPDAQVAIKGFEETVFPDNSIQFAIGNVPFADVKLQYPEGAKTKVSLHNYFLLHTLDKLKPGAGMAMITSRYTMDAVTNKDIRDQMADKAELVAAIRLPDTAFKQNAGTDVVTDILFFRKRYPGEERGSKNDNAFSETQRIDLTKPGEKADINEYFVAHPEMVLGEHALEGKMYGPGQYTVKLDKEKIDAKLAEALKALPKNVFNPDNDAAHADVMKVLTSLELAPDEIKEKALTINKDGKVVQKIKGILRPISIQDMKDSSKLKSLIAVRDALKNVITLQQQTSDDAAVEPARKTLNQTYDAHVKKYGEIDNRRNTPEVFRDDPEYPLIRALERITVQPNPNGKGKTLTVVKADIFTKRTAAPIEPLSPSSFPKDPKAMLSVMLGATGTANIKAMAEISGVPAETISNALEQDGLIFTDPEGGQTETAAEYLSGNVRAKLKAAQKAAEIEPGYKRNVEALEKVQPKDLTMFEVTARPGATWIPSEAYEDFLRAMAGSQGDITVSRNIQGEWNVAPKYGFNLTKLNSGEFSAGGADGLDIFTDTLNQRMVTVRYRDSDGNVHVDKDKTTAAREMQNVWRDKFKEWTETSNWTQPLNQLYNEKINNLAPRQYDGAHLTFPGMVSELSGKEFHLNPHQYNFAWRVIQDGRGLAAHDVGAGKTFESIAAAMEMKRMGMSPKNMFVVPNNMREQWNADWLRLYPTANVLVVQDDDFTAENRNRLLSRIATGNYDGIIMVESQFTRLRLSPQEEAKFVRKEVAELRAVLEDTPKSDRRTIKEIEKAIAKLEAGFAELLNKEHDNTVYFDQLGITSLFVDEAHYYKNLGYKSRMGNIAGLANSNADRARLMKMKAEYLQAQNHGRGLIFLTGTPVSNTMGEMYNMIRYVAPDLLERAGMRDFDDWAAAFGTVKQKVEYAPDGVTLRAKNRFAQFINMPDLQAIFNQFADVKMRADLPEIKRPDAIRENIEVTLTPAQSEMLYGIVERAAKLGEKKGPALKGEDNWLKLSGDARKISLDARLMDSQADAEQSKIAAAANKIYEIWKKEEDKKGTQLVFSDFFRSWKGTGKDKKPDFDVFAELKRQLVDLGIPASEIAFIHQFKKGEETDRAQQAMREGKIRVMMGSTQKMGVGLNVQERLKALHHLDQPMKPSEMTQREGRIERQGNTYSTVNIYRYISVPATKEKSMRYNPMTHQDEMMAPPVAYDVQMFQMLENKAGFITQVLTNQNADRTIDDAAGDVVMDYASLKAAATGDPNVMKKVALIDEVNRYRALQRSFNTSRADASYGIQKREANIPRYQAEAKYLDSLADQWSKYKDEEFDAVIDGQKFTERKEASKYLEENQNGRTELEIYGTKVAMTLVRTGSLRNDKGQTEDIYHPYFSINGGPQDAAPETAQGIITAVENRMRRARSRADTLRDSIKEAEQGIADLREALTKKFPQQAKLDAAEDELGEVNVAMGLTRSGMVPKVEDDVVVDPNAIGPETDKDEEGIDQSEGGEPKKPSGGTTLHSGFLDPAVFAEIFPDAADRVRDWAADTVGEGDQQREMMRQTRGEKDRKIAIALKQLDKARKNWTLRSRADSIRFFNAVEHNLGLTPADLDPKDEALAKLFDQAFGKMKKDIQKLKPQVLQDYIEHYFPHIWKRPSIAGGIIRDTLQGKRPFAGKGSFLKKRTIPTIQDGIDMGLTPDSWNPVDLFLKKYNEMAQWLMAHKTLDMMKDAGTAKYVRIGKKPPDGWVKLDDRISTVYRRVKAVDEDKLADALEPLKTGAGVDIMGADIDDIEESLYGALSIAGHYYAPAEAATVFNHFVSQGLAGRSTIYDAVQWANNNINALQLGISFFHFTTTAVNGSTSSLALGIENLMHGQVFDGAKNLVFGAATIPAIVQTAVNGSRMMRQYLEPGTYAKFQEEANALTRAGGRAKMNTLEVKPWHKMINAFRNRAILEGVGQIPATILAASVAPVMDYWVPRMKLGAFYALAHDILKRQNEKQPDGSIKLRWSEEELRRRLQRAWNSIDNRFGQVVYDNLFWHKALRDVLMLATRSVGWNYGDIAELGGGALDTLREASKAIGLAGPPKLPPGGTTGAYITHRLPPGGTGGAGGGGPDEPRFTGGALNGADITHRMAFSYALPLWTAIFGAALTYLWNRRAPLTWKDYFYPPTPDGERHSIPGYMKDVFAFAEHPISTVLNKMAPIWEMTAEAVNNRDFYGVEIRHKDDPIVKQAYELARFALNQNQPFAFSGSERLLQKKGEDVSTFHHLVAAMLRHPADVALGNLGFQPAPAYIQNSPALNKARDYAEENKPPGTRTREQFQQQQAKRSVEDMYRTGNVQRDIIADYIKRGLLTQQTKANAMLDAKRDPLTATVRYGNLSLEQLLNVYDVADDKEQKDLRPLVAAKAGDIQKQTEPEKRQELRDAFNRAMHARPVPQSSSSSARASGLY